MSKKYPRLGGPTKHYKPQAQMQPTLPKCEICGGQTVAGIHMEVDYMRGNDEFFRVCDEHLKLAKSDGEGFYKAYFAAQENDDGKESNQLEEPVA